MKKFSVQVIALLILIGGSLIFFSPSGKSPSLDIPFLPQKTQISKLEIDGAVLIVEIADTASKRNKGLGNRDSLGQDQGMLFIFDKVDKYNFWMKGLKFPLDFIWIKNGQVVDILQNIQPPAIGQEDKDLPIYTSKEVVDKVLEVNAGVVQKLGIKVGDIIKVTPQ